MIELSGALGSGAATFFVGGTDSNLFSEGQTLRLHTKVCFHSRIIFSTK
jgi:hypothetical protein